MTTPRDLLIVTTDMESLRPVERGDLSLALAAAELIDLLGAQVVGLDGDRVVPRSQREVADRLLGEAVVALVRQEPYESVADWLWRRGRDLSTAYLAAFEAEGQLVRQRRHRWSPARSSRMVLVDSPARSLAADRWRADEPVLASLATAVGIRDARTVDSPGVTDEAVARVLHAVDNALAELAVERERRAHKRDQAAVDNVQRGY